MNVYQAVVIKDKFTDLLEAIEGIELTPINVDHNDAVVLVDAHRFTLVLLDLPSTATEQQDQLLRKIRSATHDLAAGIPLFCRYPSDLSPYLSDGLIQEQNSWRQFLDTFYQRQEQLLKHNGASSLDRFLAYAWPRPEFVLAPRWCLQTKTNYQYPLLDCLKIEDDQNLLAQWRQSDIIKEQKLVDRVRQCPRCDSEHLNYVDICPRCKSIDISSNISLHCFTCGHVGEQAEFQLDTALRCPTCLTQLRHIGVDYDRPLERFHCGSCDHRFIEGQVVANCHEQHQHSPDQLKERRIYRYELGPAAEQIASLGRIFDNRALQWGESTSIENFSWLLRWSNASAQRHDHQHVLLFLNWQGVAEAITQLGEDRALAQIAELQSRLHSVIRQTDVFAEIDADKAAILLCHTSLKWLDQIAQKLASIEAVNDSSILKLQVRNFPLPDKDLPENTQSWLLAQANKLELVDAG